MTTKNTIQALAQVMRISENDLLELASSAGVDVTSSESELTTEQLSQIVEYRKKRRQNTSSKRTLSLGDSGKTKPSRLSISGGTVSQSGNVSVVRKRKIPISNQRQQPVTTPQHSPTKTIATKKIESKQANSSQPIKKVADEDSGKVRENYQTTVETAPPEKPIEAEKTFPSIANEKTPTKQIRFRTKTSPDEHVSSLVDIQNRRNIPVGRGAVVDLSAKLQAKKPKPAKTHEKISKKQVSDLQKTKGEETNAPITSSVSKPKVARAKKPETTLQKEKKPVVKTIRASDKKNRHSGGKTTRQPNELATDELQLNEYQRRRNNNKDSDNEKRNEPLRSTLLTQNFVKPVSEQMKVLQVGETIEVGELAHRLGVKTDKLIKELTKLKISATVTQVVDFDTAEFIADHFGHQISFKDKQNLEEQVLGDTDDYQKISRAPVITVMGHVDHGKTSLLDFIRATRVAQGESGGITQHIGAYQVHTPQGAITFIDTPGHAAFTAMRARGAQVTDIVILVVASDSRVMPQTIEAIQHARAAGAPIVVALNKIDLPAADPDRLTNELVAQELVPEDWGGDTQFVKVSAHTGEGVDKLLEAIHLQAEMLELRARVDGTATGVVVESWLDKNRGALTTVLVKEGRLSIGQYILAGGAFGRIRAMHDALGKKLSVASPSTPVEILGLNETPEAGDELVEIANERAAKELIHQRLEERKRKTQPARVIASDPFSDTPVAKTLRLVIKADTQGSLGAIIHALGELQTDQLSLDVSLSGVGGITESDVSIAHATGAKTIGFNVRAEKSAQSYVEKEHLDVKYYSIIYELIEEIDNALHGLLEPIVEEKILGIAEVRDVFSVSKFGKIAGSMVTEGTIFRNKPIRVLRENVVVYEGELESLKRFKDDVREVRNGMECGIGVKNYRDVRAGDKIEVFDRIEKRPERIRRESKKVDAS